MTTDLADDRIAAPEEPTGSRLDDWWARVLSVSWRVAAWRWAGPLAVTLLGALLRFVDLGRPHSLVFDETYYVKDGWSLVHLGYEGTWPANPTDDTGPTTDERFAAGDTSIYSAAAEFIAHPPLGKWLIGLGMLLFGPEDSFGWRFAVAVLGTACVFLVAVIARSLFRSTAIGTLAGLLLAIDGQAIVMSRVTLLDGIVTFWVLLAFGALLLDRRWNARRLAAWVARRAEGGRDTLWGPTLWRPWLLAVGLLCGVAAGTKWTGAYFLAFFAVYAVLSDVVLRRRAGVGFWLSSGLLKQAPVAFVLTVPVAAATYVASWTGWFVTKGGWDRDWIGSGGGHRWTGAFAWVPDAFQNWWYYQTQIYDFNIGLHTPHSYQANPLTWLLMTRPTSMYYEGTDAGQAGCAADRCGAAITGIANPFIWYAAVVATVVLLVLWVVRRRWEYGFVVLGVAAGYLPWLLYVDRTVFQFYTVAFEPYMVMALAAAIGVVLGSRTDPRHRRTTAIVWVGVYLGVVVLASAYWYPMWTAIQTSWDFVRSHYWLQSWL